MENNYGPQTISNPKLSLKIETKIKILSVIQKLKDFNTHRHLLKGKTTKSKEIVIDMLVSLLKD